MFPAGKRKQLIQTEASQSADDADVSLGVCLTRNFFHAKERFSLNHATAPSSGEVRLLQSWRQSLIYLSNFAIPEQRSVVSSCFRVDREQHHAGSFSIETMNRGQGFRCALFSQSHQKRFTEKSP